MGQGYTQDVPQECGNQSAAVVGDVWVMCPPPTTRMDQNVMVQQRNGCTSPARWEMQKKRPRIKVRPCFNPDWLVKRFTTFTPLRFTYDTNTQTAKGGVQQRVPRVNYSRFSTYHSVPCLPVPVHDQPSARSTCTRQCVMEFLHEKLI